MFQGDAIPGERVDLRNLYKEGVFWLVHLACLLTIWSGVSAAALAVCFILYFIRIFAITGAYHRYFSHKTYETSRIFQFLLAFLGATAAQKGPIWWASHHRYHHKHADTPEDIHSPLIQGIYYAHVGWVLSPQFTETRADKVPDLLKFPELRLIDKFYMVPPTLLAISVYFFGEWTSNAYPALGTSGFQMLIWGFFVSTVLCYHGTFCINSLCHLFGRRRFNTRDDSRNSFILALVTLGEGWHNNHHRFPGAEKQGYYWWEIDITHYILRLFEMLGLVWNIRRVPESIYKKAGAVRAGVLETAR